MSILSFEYCHETKRCLQTLSKIKARSAVSLPETFYNFNILHTAHNIISEAKQQSKSIAKSCQLNLISLFTLLRGFSLSNFTLKCQSGDL